MVEVRQCEDQNWDGDSGTRRERMNSKGLITEHWATGLGSQLHELGEREGFK